MDLQGDAAAQHLAQQIAIARQHRTSFYPMHGQTSDGWYVVANWTDEIIAMNDAPFPDYDGSSTLMYIPNGTVLYVT